MVWWPDKDRVRWNLYFCVFEYQKSKFTIQKKRSTVYCFQKRINYIKTKQSHDNHHLEISSVLSFFYKDFSKNSHDVIKLFELVLFLLQYLIK